MALKKPSEYFKKDIATGDNSVQELIKAPELNTFSDTLDDYRVNIERVNHLSEKVEDIRTEIQTLLKKEDLDRAMMSQLLVVGQSIHDVQSKVKSINENKLTEIRLDVSGLMQSVNEFLEVEVPQYKKLIVDSELRTDNRFTQLEENVNQTLQGINEQGLAGIFEDFKLLDENFAKLKEEEIPKYTESKLEEFNTKTDSKLEEFNQQLVSFEENVKDRIDNVQSHLKEFVEVESPKLLIENKLKTEEEVKEIQKNIEEKVSQFVSESKLEEFNTKTDSKLEEFNQQLVSFEENVKDRIDNVQSHLKEFVEVESPKYNKLLIENKLKTEEEVKEIQKNIEEKVSQFFSDIETLKSNALSESKGIDKFVTEKIIDFKKVLTETQKDVKKTLSTYTSISKTFESKVNSDNEKLNSYDETLKDFSVKISECLSQVLLFKEEIEINEEIQNEWKDVLREELSQRIKEYREELNEEVTSVQNDLTKKVSDLEINIGRNESHLKVQNKNLEQIQEDVRSAIQKLNIEELEDKNYELGKKIKYLEEVFEKFSEKEIITENILAEPPSTDNKDPLTPLDQNFVTLDQLQQHYRSFINRIQQQLATIGGGGETQLKYLDDIVGIATNASAYDDKFLKYNHGIRKFVFETVSEGTGSQTLDETLGFGNTSSIGMSVGVTTATKLHVDPVGSGVTYNEDLVVQGNARVTGILSIGTSSIVLDSNTKEIRGVEKIRIEPEEPDLSPIFIKQNAEKIIFVKTEEINGEEVETESEASVGIGSTVSINTTGIITASSFFGDGSGLTGIIASGSGVVVQNNGSNVGTASTINFGSDLDATFSGGVATINVSIPLSAITDVNTSNLSGITTDYLMVYDPLVPGFKFVDPKTYFGINNDANPDPTIDDFGSY